MKVFTIIVTFNGFNWIERCLDKLRESTVCSEIIIVDNNSTDNTVLIIKTSYPEVTLIENKQNLGFGKANNIGIARALEMAGDYYFLLNQDALIFPNTLGELIEINRKHPEFVILSPIHLDGTNKRIDYKFIRYLQKSKQFISDSSLPKISMKDVYSVNFINAALWLVSKECILNIGGFDPLYQHYGEDNDYTCRVIYHGYKLGFCPNVFGVHDRSQDELASHMRSGEKRFNYQYKDYMIILKNINKPFLTCILKLFQNVLAEVFKCLFRLQVKNCAVELKAVLYLLKQLNRIYNHRYLVKLKGPTFLTDVQIPNNKTMSATISNFQMSK